MSATRTPNSSSLPTVSKSEGSVLDPRQSVETPAGFLATMFKLVQFALETFDDIERVAKLRAALGLGCCRRPLAAAADEQQNLLLARLALELADEARVA